jgi:ankyrin repeat protein
MTLEDYAQYMHTHKFDPEKRPEDRGDAIHSAVLNNRADIAAELLTLYPKDCLEARSRKSPKKWRTPLHNACELGRTAIVKTLLDKGADVNARSFHQLTPLIFAAEAENIEVVRLLISKGAEVNAQSDEKTKTRSALHVAAQIEAPSIILALLLSGAEPKLVTTAGNTPLHLAIQSGCASAAALLLFHGASPTITNEKGASPRSLVERLRQGDHKRFNHIFECASEKGDFGNFFNRHTKPDAPIDMIAAIHWAIAHNLDRAIAYLLHIDSHAVEARSPQGWHPLHRAARAGYDNCVIVLLEHGAGVDCTTKSGWTPLMMAAEKGDNKVLQILLDHGASRAAKNDNGDTAWKIARHNGHRLPMLLAIKHVAPSEVDGNDAETGEKETLKPPKDRSYCRTPSPGPRDGREKVGKFNKECSPNVSVLLTYVGELYALYDAKIDETSTSASEKFVSLST